MTKPFFNPCWIVDKRALWLRRGCDQSRAQGHVGSLSAVWLSEIFCSLVAKQTRRQIGWAFVTAHGRSLLCLSQPPTFNLFSSKMYTSSMAKKEPYERNSFYNLRPLPSRGTRKRNPDEDFILRGRRTPVRYTSSY